MTESVWTMESALSLVYQISKRNYRSWLQWLPGPEANLATSSGLLENLLHLLLPQQYRAEIQRKRMPALLRTDSPLKNPGNRFAGPLGLLCYTSNLRKLIQNDLYWHWVWKALRINLEPASSSIIQTVHQQFCPMSDTHISLRLGRASNLATQLSTIENGHLRW